jgi:hypothetical protein
MRDTDRRIMPRVVLALLVGHGHLLLLDMATAPNGGTPGSFGLPSRMFWRRKHYSEMRREPGRGYFPHLCRLFEVGGGSST